MKNRITIALLAALGIALFAAFLSAAHKYINWRETGKAQSNVSWLPDYASNVSFTRTNSWRGFEFDVTESDFRTWASGYELSEIQEPFYIERYNYTDSTGIGGSESELVDPPQFDPKTVAIVRNGLKYRSWTDSRGGVSVCFDRDENRAYFLARDR